MLDQAVRLSFRVHVKLFLSYRIVSYRISGLQFRGWQYGSIVIRLDVIASETRQMSRNSKRNWPYSSPRSSILVSMESPYDFLLVIVTLAVSATVYEIFTVGFLTTVSVWILQNRMLFCLALSKGSAHFLTLQPLISQALLYISLIQSLH